MVYIKVTQAAEKWGITPRRVRMLCAEGKIPGIIRKGKLYMIPEDTPKPFDGRKKLVSVLAEIEAKRERLSQMRPLTPPEVKRLLDEFMIEFTYNSNAIEGNTLTLSETKMVLEGITIAEKPLKEHLEAVGQRDAFLYIENIGKEQIPLSESVIKHIHSLVLIDRAEYKGVFRRIPARIMGACTEPVQPYLIEPKITELLAINEERKQSMNAIERIARFHLTFEGIHPFIDGNGRTGRLIMNLDLIRCGYPTINVKFTDRRKYYEAFDAYYRDGDASVMTALIAGYVNERLDRYLDILSAID